MQVMLVTVILQVIRSGSVENVAVVCVVTEQVHDTISELKMIKFSIVFASETIASIERGLVELTSMI